MARIDRLIQSADARAAAASKFAQATVEALAQAAFAKMWRFLVENPDADPREAIQAAQVEFGGAFSQSLAEAFETLLERTISLRELVAMPIAGLSLSRKLYLHNVTTAAEVLGVIREHAKGVHQARDLSLALYDGYNPGDGIRRPLEGSARAQLPKALRSLTDDPTARRTLTTLQVQGQKQAARLKSRALRAAYLESFDAWTSGASTQALKRKLEVAQREKNRFFADRIAQTELHRAHMAQVSAELMADPVEVVQVRLNPTHPRTDICDLHARADLWGLGAGCYPKEEAPRPSFHPFCRCRLKSKPSLFAPPGMQPTSTEGAFLASLGDEEAARIMGSMERWQRVQRGEPVEAIINEGKDPLYRLLRIGDAKAVQHPLVKVGAPA